MVLTGIQKNGGGFLLIQVNLLAVFVIVNVASIPLSGDSDCIDAGGKAGRCTGLKSCAEIVALLRPEITSSEKVFLRNSQCGDSAPNSIKVCCAISPKPDKNVKEEIWEEIHNPLIPSSDICGMSFEDKIVGGNETDLDEYPWMALLQYTKENGVKDFLCGGALVSDRYILTAAHCVPNSKTKLTGIHLGEWDLDYEDDCVNGICSDDPQDIDVESVTIHENYQSSDAAQKNDIALVRMVRPVTYSHYISPICLPLISEVVSKRSHVGNDLVVSGWGKTETAKESNVKLKVSAPVIDPSKCKEAYKRVGVGLAPTQFCAGGRALQDSCNGDSGGPLMAKEIVNNSDNWFVRGVVSFGPSNCGTPGFPGVYTDVSKYGKWIAKNIKP